MNWFSAIILLAVTWWLVFFIVLPLRLVTQGEDGKVEHGTTASSPASFSFRRKAKITTIWALLIWAGLCAIIVSGVITLQDIDLFHRFNPPH
ncbi:MAG: DUF1467 family protein [Limimaricola sp.]|uniref:DUF1467 family protein n=1 Tax=Limimaricola sp. TaxID=2211665 RepID=UPI001D4611F0|nr:DUF1467 family protein [Limimaricola sp.]MBI1415846.1 DUF1467 family protein [Limimaricola sp.]